jgi:hypothetical protein
MKSPWLWNDFIWNLTKTGKDHEKCLQILKKFTRNVILTRSKDFDDENLNSKRIAFLDTLLKYKKEDQKITFDDIQEEVDTFMLVFNSIIIFYLIFVKFQGLKDTTQLQLHLAGLVI